MSDPTDTGAPADVRAWLMAWTSEPCDVCGVDHYLTRTTGRPRNDLECCSDCHEYERGYEAGLEASKRGVVPSRERWAAAYRIARLVDGRINSLGEDSWCEWDPDMAGMSLIEAALDCHRDSRMDDPLNNPRRYAQQYAIKRGT